MARNPEKPVYEAPLNYMDGKSSLWYVVAIGRCCRHIMRHRSLLTLDPVGLMSPFGQSAKRITAGIKTLQPPFRIGGQRSWPNGRRANVIAGVMLEMNVSASAGEIVPHC